MTVTIRAGSWARRFIPEVTVLTLDEGALLSDALAALPIPEDEVGPAVIEGLVARGDRKLCEGDEIEIYPSIIGG